MEPICNCNDEFRTEPCPVHHKDIKIDKDIILTDNELIPEQYGRWEGLIFMCPQCGKPAVMDFSKFCANCGVKVRIHSKILTDVVKKSIEMKK
jgi:hypothetical protein